MEFKKGKEINKEDLPEDWEATVKELMSVGAHVLETHLAIGVTRSQHKTLLDKEEDYKFAFDLGKDLSESWWFETGRKGVKDKSFNTGFYAFCMKNRFNWADSPIGAKGEPAAADKKQEEQSIISDATSPGRNSDAKLN